MDENKTNIENVLRKVSVILTCLSVVMFVFAIVAIAINRFDFSAIVIILIILSIGSLVLASIVKPKEKEKDAKVIINAILVFALPIPLFFAASRAKENREDEELGKLMRAETSIDYLKNTKIWEYKINLQEYISEEEIYTYSDTDGNVTAKFLSLDFSIDQSNHDISYPIQFIEASDYSVCFSLDYTFLCISSSGLLDSHSSWYTYSQHYKLSEDDASEFKQTIKEEIERQKQLTQNGGTNSKE